MHDRSIKNRIFELQNLSIVVVVLAILVGMLGTFSDYTQLKRNLTTAYMAESGKYPVDGYIENGHRKYMVESGKLYGDSPAVNDLRKFQALSPGTVWEWLLKRFISQDHASGEEDNAGKASSDHGQLTSQPDKDGLGIKNVNEIYIDSNNIKWFCTESGIVSYDGINWNRYDGHENIPYQDLNGVINIVDSVGSKLWIASPQGATVVRLPMDDHVEIFTFKPENSEILSQEVLAVASGKNTIRWIGTDRGISAISNGAWYALDYQMHYTKNMFRDFPITSMATNSFGDTLYAGTAGAGVARVYRDELDAISGASVYAEWGPIIMPSDHILSIFIAPDGRKWFGTDKGIATHIGDDTLDNWIAYTTDGGLIDNYVQAICMDMNGNIWFGTPAGISVFDGSSWKSYTTDDGLDCNNIKSLATDSDGVIWIGSEAGIMSYEDGEFINY